MVILHLQKQHHLTTWGSEASDYNSDSIYNIIVMEDEYFPGYISNARFVNGTTLYTSSFTPQTAELPKFIHKVTFSCQSSSSVTAEATGGSVTAGSAAASTTNPSLVKGFDLSGSVAFDGNSDYLHSLVIVILIFWNW